MSNSTFFSLQKKLLVLVLSASVISILITTIIFLNFDNIPIFQMEENIVIIGIALMIGISVITYFLAKRLSKPLTDLSNAANKIAQGDFNVRTNIKSRDEIGELSSSFDFMAKKLQESIIEIKNRDEIIKEQEDLLLKFSEDGEECCVCMVDIIDSTKKTRNLSGDKTSKFYEIFINSIAHIVEKFDGIVVKNIGDSLLYYFPITSSTKKAVLSQTLHCCIAMCSANKEVNQELHNNGMPEIDFRVSATYGTVSMARMKTSAVEDLFGETVNRCAKINRSALPNTLVIGQPMYHLVKEHEEFSFRKIEKNTIDNQSEYTVYLVTKN